MRKTPGAVVRGWGRAIAVCGVLVGGCFAPSWSVADEPAETAAVSLRPAWTLDQSARFHFTNTRTSTSELVLPDRTIDTDFKIVSEGEVTWTVDRVNADGSAVCTMTLDWMLASLTTPDGNTMENDSRKGSGDEPFMHGVLKAMAGKALKVTVGSDGSVLEVDGLRAIRDAAEDPDSMPDETDFRETATELAVLAGVPLALEVGDDWDVDQTWNFGIVGMDIGSLDQSWAYRLEGVEEIEGVPVAIVSGETERMKMDASAANEGRPDGMPEVRVKLADGKATTQVLFDLSRNEAVGRQATMSTTVEMDIPLPNGRTVKRTVREVMESQTVRIAEGS